MKSLRSAFATLSQKNVQVIGISMDTVAEQKAFSDKFQLPFPLLADTTGQICDAFRVIHPNSKPRRETFLFKNGRLIHHDRSPNTRRQAEDVLQLIEKL